MRIVIVADYVGTSRGGSECYFSSLAGRLIADGHDLHVFHNRVGDQVEGGKYYLVRVPAYPRFLREWSFCRQVDARVRELSPDAVFTARPLSSATHYRLSNGIHLHCFEAEREAFDMTLRRWLYRTGLRTNPRRQLLIRAQSNLLRRPNRPRLMTNSETARRQLWDSFGISPGEVTVLYSGLDLDQFRPAGSRRPIRDKLLFVGHHFALKGLQCAMLAMASPGSADLGLLLQVVGSGPIRQFQKLSARLGISSRVEFLGAVPRRQMPDLYRASSALVHPTFYDPCSLASLEAMACGCPVITTARNGASELIEPGRNGWVIDHPRDIEALAAAIRAASCLAVSEEAGREAARTAREKLDLNEHVKAVVKWLGA